MAEHKTSSVASVVGGSGGKPGRCFASVAGLQADDTWAPPIALGTARSTINALRTSKDREQAAQTKAKRTTAFTLAELLVSMGVLVLLVFLATQLLNSAATVTILGHKQMDADSQARQLLDRMTIDFAQMVKRPDVDYFLKSSSGAASDCGVCSAQAGNDQAAFYSTVPGYNPTPTATPTASPIGTSPFSLVSYRVNSDSTSSSYNKLERMGKGLAWNGVSPGSSPNASSVPLVFLPQTIGGPPTGGGNWPSAVSSSATDSSYEVIGSQVFRFEYYYLLKGQVVSGTTYNPIFTDTPWDTRIPGHTSVSGMRDVTAIIADIAVIDPKSKVLVTDAQLARINGADGGAPVLVDYAAGMTPGDLLANWRAALDANVYPNGLGLPAQVISGIRVYERYFYLNQ